MDFSLTEEQKALKKVARDFAEKEIAPHVEDDEREHRFRIDILKKMGELGFFGCVIPESYGGNEAGLLASVLMTEEISHTGFRKSIRWRDFLGTPNHSRLWRARQTYKSSS